MQDKMCHKEPIPFMPKMPMYAHAYVPMQQPEKVFSPEEALRCGTLYPSLVMPYDPIHTPKDV